MADVIDHPLSDQELGQLGRGVVHYPDTLTS